MFGLISFYRGIFYINIEALARNEENPNSRTCFQYWRKAPNNDSLTYCDCISVNVNFIGHLRDSIGQLVQN